MESKHIAIPIFVGTLVFVFGVFAVLGMNKTKNNTSFSTMEKEVNHYLAKSSNLTKKEDIDTVSSSVVSQTKEAIKEVKPAAIETVFVKETVDKSELTSQDLDAIANKVKSYFNKETSLTYEDVEKIVDNSLASMNLQGQKKTTTETIVLTSSADNIAQSVKTLSEQLSQINSRLNNMDTNQQSLKSDLTNLQANLDTKHDESIQYTNTMRAITEEEIKKLADKSNISTELLQSLVDRYSLSTMAQLEAFDNALTESLKSYKITNNEKVSAISYELSKQEKTIQSILTQEHEFTENELEKIAEGLEIDITAMYQYIDNTQGVLKLNIDSLSQAVGKNTTSLQNYITEKITITDTDIQNLAKKLDTTEGSLKVAMALQESDLKKYTNNLTDGLSREVDSLSTDSAELSKSLSDTSKDLSSTKSDLSDTQSDLANTKKDLANTKTDVESNTTGLSETKEDLENTKDDLASTKDDVATNTGDIADTKSALDNLEEEFEDSVSYDKTTNTVTFKRKKKG